MEGLDGAGKSTQIKLLREMVEKAGWECEYLHFPRFDAPVYGDMIARFLRGEFGSVEQVNPYLVALLYAGDRANAATQIRAWMAEGKCVIVDRYVYSNIGYQCAKVESAEERKKLAEWIYKTEFEEFQIPRPTLSLFLDVPFGFTEAKLTSQREGADRDYLGGAQDIHEKSLDLQRRVREVYLEAARTESDFEVVDCSNAEGAMASPEEIFGRVAKAVKPLLELRIEN